MGRKPKYSPKNPRKRNPVGRPTPLNNELYLKIRELVILGYTYTNIQIELKIPQGTWDRWACTNYEGFRDKLTTYDHEYKLRLAEENINKILNIETNEQAIGMFGPLVDKKTKKAVMKQNDKLMKIKSDVSLFVTETLGRKHYTKKVEMDDVTNKKIILLG